MIVYSPTDADGINPIDPEIKASSVKISPNKFSVINTSYEFGH
jgi:hypothetical protein